MLRLSRKNNLNCHSKQNQLDSHSDSETKTKNTAKEDILFKTEAPKPWELFPEYAYLFTQARDSKDKQVGISEVVMECRLENRIYKLHEIMRLINYKTPRKYLTGLYLLKKQLELDSSLSTRMKLVEKSQFLEKSLLVLKSNPDFVLLVLKLITLLLKVSIPKVISLVDQILSEYIVDNLFQSDDTQIVIYSINLIYKIIKTTAPKTSRAQNQPNESLERSGSSSNGSRRRIVRSNWSLDRMHLLMEKLLAVSPNGMNNPEAILAVKYKTFNDLVGRLPVRFWPDYAFIWIIFSCDIFDIGLVIDYRNLKFEKWLVGQTDLLRSFIQTPHCLNLLKEKAYKSSSIIFFLFFVFKSLKVELISQGLRGRAQQVVLEIPETAVYVKFYFLQAV